MVALEFSLIIKRSSCWLRMPKNALASDKCQAFLDCQALLWDLKGLLVCQVRREKNLKMCRVRPRQLTESSELLLRGGCTWLASVGKIRGALKTPLKVRRLVSRSTSPARGTNQSSSRELKQTRGWPKRTMIICLFYFIPVSPAAAAFLWDWRMDRRWRGKLLLLMPHMTWAGI